MDKEAGRGCGRAVQTLQMEGVIAAAAHCDVTSKAEVETLICYTVQQVRYRSHRTIHPRV